MIRIEKILYPTDFSSYSNQAYFHAIAQAESHGASLTVLFVYTPDMITPGSEGDEDADRRAWVLASSSASLASFCPPRSSSGPFGSGHWYASAGPAPEGRAYGECLGKNRSRSCA